MSATLSATSTIPYTKILPSASGLCDTYLKIAGLSSLAILTLGLVGTWYSRFQKAEFVERTSAASFIFSITGLALHGAATIAKYAAINFGLLGATLAGAALGGWLIPKAVFEKQPTRLGMVISLSLLGAGIVSGLNTYCN